MSNNIYAQTILNIDNVLGTAFSALRTSQPRTLFDSKQLFDLGNTFWDDAETSGGGTGSVFSQNAARTRISVADTTAGTRLRQTFQRFNYEPGKGQRIFMTCNNFKALAGNEKGFGIMDDNNGLALIYNSSDDTVYFRRRSSVSGSPVDTDEAILTNVLGDGKTPIEFDKVFILDIDFEWLGVGRVRAFYSYAGQPVKIYERTFANDFTTVYMSTPNLPLRYWITNDGTGAADYFDHICASVQSEGGAEELGISRGASTGGTAITCALENTVYALGGLRVRSGYESAIIKLQSVSAQIQTASENAEFFFALKPTLSSTLNWADQYNSAASFGVGNGTQTVSGNYVSWNYGHASTGNTQQGAAGANLLSDNARYPGVAIDGTPEEIIFCWRPIGGTAGHEVEFAFNWKELV